MNIHESAEDYLEKILMLQEQKGSVRSIDIAVAMGYSKPSVSRAMGLLRGGGYVQVSPDTGHISLTDAGRAVAEKIYERHTLLTALLENLGVASATAAEDACKMEHVISDESFAALKQLEKRLCEEAK